MTTSSSLIDLKKTLPQTSWSTVIHALRQDALIWQTLQKRDFLKIAISKLGSNPKMWTPANLALLSLETDLDSEKLRSTSLSKLDPELRLQAIQTYEAHVSDTPPDMTLATAGLLALALQEHNRLTNSWEKIPHTSHWLTAYVCLFNLIEKPIQLLRGLPIPIQIHTILANPLSKEDQTHILKSISLPLATSERLVMLRELNRFRPNLSRAIARKLWRGEEDSMKLTKDSQIHLNNLTPIFESIQTLTYDLNSFLAHAEAQLAAGHNNNGATSLKLAWENAKQIQNTLAGKVSQVTAQLGDIENSRSDWAKAHNPTEMEPVETATLALIWLEQGYVNEAQSLLEKIIDKSTPLVFLAQSSIAIHQGDTNTAKTAALKASEAASRMSVEFQLNLAEQLLKLKLASEAVYVLDIVRQLQPNHLNAIRLAAQANASVGAYPQAIHTIHLAVAFEPENLDIQRDYALFHEFAGLWPAAMETRKNIINAQNNPQSADFHSLAKCALVLDQYQQAQKACNLAFEKNAKDGVAHALLGDVLLELGNHEMALEHLEKAVQYTPDQVLPWLAMSRFFKKVSKHSEATETLLKATHAAPDQAEIHLALGEDYLLAGSHSQALTYLRKAHQLINIDSRVEAYHLQSRIALPLAKTLFELGHADEALNTIQTTFPLPENQVSLLHLHAQILIFLKQAENAIPLLAKALLTDPSNAAINIDYARAQLEANHDPGKAISALLALLEIDPQNTEALAWLAESMRVNGDPTNALIAYRRALGTQLSSDSYWHPRLSIGLAQSALELDQPETALAALQRDWQTSPQNHLIILQTLALAYKMAKLYEKSLQSARSALEIDPNSLTNLMWFADLADGIQAYDEAVNALNKAIELEPNRVDYLIKLGLIHQKVGDLSEAHKTFKRVAELDQATSEELHTTGKYLIELDKPEDAVICLKIAVRRCLERPDEKPCSILLFEMIDIYRQLGMHAEALASVDEYLDAQPEKDPAVLGKRVLLLNQIGRGDDAFAALDQAFNEYPNSNPLHMSASRIHYSVGNLPKALEHAELALHSIGDDEFADSPCETLIQAADIADACLQGQTANGIIKQIYGTNFPWDLSYLCMRSELALESDEEIDAAKTLTAALTISPEHPRVLALQARLTARRGDLNSARQIFQNALSTWGKPHQREITSPAEMLGISEAALELHEWDSATYLLQESVDQFPQEPRTHLRLARGLVLRAEFQRLCETLRVIHHAPGLSAIAHYTYQQFEQAIMAVVKTSDALNISSKQSAITHWQVRGQAIFQPSEEHTRALGEIPHTPESHAAYLAACRYNQENLPNKQSAKDEFSKLSEPEAQNFDSPIRLIAEIALSLRESNPRLAIETAKNAVASSIRQNNPSQPIFYAVLAFIAEQTGDLEIAGSALENALSVWEGEARWHLWIAEIQRAQAEPDYGSVLNHLSQAVKLEPKYGFHHLRLGETYLETNNTQDAIPALEEATRLLSDQAISWLTLAYAHHISGDIAQIFSNAERAVELDPSNIDPYILLAQTALEIDNPKKTIQYCQGALEVDATHPQALLLQARALDKVGKSSEALQSFEQALENTPRSIPLMLEHAQLTRRVSGTHAEVEALQILSCEYPENGQVLAALAEALVDNNQLDMAI